MSKHEHFKELCALAALGEVPPAKEHEFKQHLRSCNDCAQAYYDYVRVNAHLFPPTDENLDTVIESRRDSTRTAVLASILEVEPDRGQRLEELALRLVSYSPQESRFARFSVIAASLVVGAFWLGTQYENVRVAASVQRPQAPIFLPPPAPVMVVDSQQNSLRIENNKLNESLKLAKQHAMESGQRLAQMDNRFSQIEQEKSDLKHETRAQAQELSQTQVQLASKTSALTQLEDAKSSDAATNVALRYQVQDLTQKLNSQSESLKREQDLLAGGREIRDIIGARNLHIVDVYDTDAKGRTKRPFARAFYTEGKSLVFYAYDLPQQKSIEDRYKYVAWGQSNGNKSSVRNLGILINDDQSQKRWMLKFSDPSVLAEIDSVFITLESTDKGLDKPSGKRMLTAYLNDQVNHP